jgi:L-asparaginase
VFADSEQSDRIAAQLAKIVHVVSIEMLKHDKSVRKQRHEVVRKKMKAIYLITTGGTIEKVYSERTGSVANVDAKIDRYLRLLRLPDAEINIVPLMNKDSLEMTDQDRVLLLGTVRAILNEKAPIVITHGTDTMVESGRHLERALPDLQVPIVLTGAMTPLGFEGSDGLQNLTESLLVVRLVSPGIYVVMHGQIFPVDRVRKDHASATFVSTENPRL